MADVTQSDPGAPSAAPTATPSVDPATIALAEPVTGIVLAGGQSKRMGRDKAWMPVAGRPMIQWVLHAVAEVTQYQMIVSRHIGQLNDLGVPVVEDRFPARGPLTGIHAGLKAAPTELCVVVACDLPMVRPELLRFLAAACGPFHAALPYVAEGAPPSPGDLVAAHEAGLQALCAAYRRACLAPLEKLLSTGSVAAVVVASVVKARIVPPEEWRTVDPDGRSFFNVNYAEDAHLAARLLSSIGNMP